MGLQRHKRRATNITTVAALSATLLAGGMCAQAQSVTHQQSGGSDVSGSGTTVVSLDFANAEFNSAVQMIQRKTGIQLVLMPNQGRPYDKVTLSLHAQPIGDVLHMVATAGGADLWEQDGVYFLGPKGSAPKPTVVPLAAGDDSAEPAAPRQFKVDKIRLKYAAPHAILHVIGADRSGVPDIFEQMRLAALQMMIESEKVNVQPYTIQGNGVQVLPGNAGGIAVGPAAPTGGGVNYGSGGGSYNNGTPNSSRSVGTGVSGSGSAPDQSAQRDNTGGQEFGRGQFPGGAGGGGFGGGFQGAGGAGQGGVPGGAQGGVQGQGGAGQPAGNAANLLPPGITAQDIYAFDGDGSLLLRYDNAQQLVAFEQLINLLDIKPRQVLIRAQFVTVLQNDTSSFGIDWNFTKVNLQVGANLGYQTANTAFINYAAGNIQTQLSFILSTGRGKVVAAPTATTLNGLPVTFFNTESIPVFLSQPIIAQNGTVALVPQLTLFPVTIQLTITPRINGDESLTLQGIVTANNVLGTVVGPDGSSAPIDNGQTVQVQRIIRNGDTMVIGGLINKNDNVQTNKVPLLGDLPLVGTLFRSHNITTQDSELLIFITPEIIPERVSNSGASSANLPGASGGPGVLP